ncbi:LOW QUALITY PROTEIN: Peptidase_S8 domain-containing protein/PA domain-containing protein, partial [Cephalotus follicularis]
VPDSWKGACEAGTNFTSSSCNKKLIGARYFYNGYEVTLGPIDTSKESKSPRDDDGHGTHTSTTAVGSVIELTSLFDYTEGNARGSHVRESSGVQGVLNWGCFSTDILASIDKAIEDAVNVMSISLGGVNVMTRLQNRGCLLVDESGVRRAHNNWSTHHSRLQNTINHILGGDFPAYASIGNGQNYSGVSLYRGSELSGKLLPLIYAANASNSTNDNLCMTGTLTPDKVRGKVVLCDRGVNPRVQKGAVVKAVGGAGMVLSNTAAKGEELVADAHLLPATSVGQKSGDAIKKYISIESDPIVTILFEGTKVGVKPSPVVAAFSSRGPNSITPNILKPDLIAPGVNILAGWSGA